MRRRFDRPLHHVMVRGLERRVIFRDDTDREDFVARVAALAEAGAWTVYAWALLPNHAHLAPLFSQNQPHAQQDDAETGEQAERHRLVQEQDGPQDAEERDEGMGHLRRGRKKCRGRRSR